MADPTRHVEPLDPRTRKCPGCTDGKISSPIGGRVTCPTCIGRREVPLRPEPTVEVYQHSSGHWYAAIQPDPLSQGEFRVYPLRISTDAAAPDALRAARLAWLRAKLRNNEDGWGWRVDFGLGKHGGFVTGPTPTEAIEAAFEAKDPKP